ncbi:MULTISPECIES: ring-cleaving dioxygenase [unclassified Mucilaginibacter]|uniref:ring-cleaving dioxygenase n=1 Tax=unclassified Mucilaginibacter TaxID=2617802 RepID=UPI000967F94F|nr:MULTISPECIES: ring-cleaving dioxygenase [unclassified Mucilaginibacter]OJW18000.1 MAG: ring-cleaving dioxygenase [Mucilaginibacter sp. 44-25]PLW89077.1 MAG: ring-cleaving dioxygenase [Mucilaginibacter sp.]HEK20344.1 ring-cleaving dioxygenase [Bacteroidota bacterium]
MENNTINGIHHITAIAGNAKRNYDFYTKTLGLRLVKKTVNFDDPETYHFYYGDKVGTPGSILTFFPWEGISAGRRGARQATEIGYSVPQGSLDFWINRFEKHNVIYNKPAEKFGEEYLTFLDPDGLKLELIVSKTADNRLPWETDEVKAENATKGFHNVTITTNKMQPTADILTNVFGYKLLEQHVNRYRFVTNAVDNANIVDLVEVAGEVAGHVAGGSVHHVAFRVKNEEVLMQYRDKIAALGLHITEKIDRNYFYSLYFREPGGVLFEIATDNPGFAVDESVEELGSHLKLPAQYEQYRDKLVTVLPKLD